MATPPEEFSGRKEQTHMKAIVFEGIEQVAYREVPMPQVPEGWTLIRVSHAGICGSDMTIFHGMHPRAKAPLIMGHEFSGYVASHHPIYPEGTLVTVFPYLSCGVCERCQNGQFHVCQDLKLVGIDRDGGMAEYAAVPASAVYPVAPGVSAKLAAFTEPVGISTHVVRAGGYRPGDSVVVFGAGGIGMATALTLRQFGAQHVIVSEPNGARRSLAKDLGFDTLDPDQDLVRQIYDRTDGIGAQFVYDCAGVQPVIDILPDAVKINGRIVIVAGYKRPPAMNFQKGMFREFSIQFVRNCTRQDYTLAGELVGKDPGYEAILNCTLPLSDCALGFAGPAGARKVLFRAE